MLSTTYITKLLKYIKQALLQQTRLNLLTAALLEEYTRETEEEPFDEHRIEEILDSILEELDKDLDN